ncbi:MAG: hypothetical protein IPH35_01100 [Rhodoferax sp.]|nr:hypothetical protein [Rhodoferax sp.]
MATQPGYRVWPARYKGFSVEIHEAQGHRSWIASREVRNVLPSLRPDKQLLQDYPYGFEKRDKGPRLFFNETTLTAELRRMGSPDALMFLAWLEKTVYYSAARKRDGAPIVQTMPATPRMDGGVEDDGADLHIPTRKLPALPKSPRPPAPEPKGGLLQRMLLIPVLALWRGDVALGRAIVAGGLALTAWIGIAYWLIAKITAPARYNGAFALKQWLVLTLILSVAAGLVWWCGGAMRCALRHHREGGGFTGSLITFVSALTLLLAVLPYPLGLAGEWLSGWWMIHVRDDMHTADVLRVEDLGRIIVRGDLGFGTYKKLEHALQMKPKLPLVQIESPGGYVVEGLAMAKLIEQNGLDTVSFERCASACTFLLAAGQERYLGAGVTVGFHRSWSYASGFGKGWSSVDYQIANYYRSRNTAEDFVQQALDTPGNRLWVPTHDAMFTAGYATKRWEDRKSGY